MVSIIKSVKIAWSFFIFFVFCNSTCISPDLSQCGKIYFIKVKEICSINPDGSEERVVYTASDPVRTLSSSPDGSKIVFVIDYPWPSGADLFIINSNGSDVKRLTYNQSAEDPTFSPDGKKIAFVNNDGDKEIYTMNLDGSNIQKLTDNTTTDRHPSFSPDGSKIVFLRIIGIINDVHVMNSDGSGVKRLTFSTSTLDYPSFSPDGTKIVFTRDDAIWIMNSDGGGQKKITSGTPTDIFPSFSPDGNKIVFSRNYLSFDIYIMNADGSNQKRLTFDLSSDTVPCFAGKPH